MILTQAFPKVKQQQNGSSTRKENLESCSVSWNCFYTCSCRNSKIRDQNSFTWPSCISHLFVFRTVLNTTLKKTFQTLKRKYWRRKSRKQSMLGWLTHGRTRLRMSAGSLHHSRPPRTRWPMWRTLSHRRWWGHVGLCLQAQQEGVIKNGTRVTDQLCCNTVQAFYLSNKFTLSWTQWCVLKQPIQLKTKIRQQHFRLNVKCQFLKMINFSIATVSSIQ